MNHQMISVIVACYNVEKYLDRCVKSLVNQSYSNLEIILVDDGSTDKTGRICDYWQDQDNRIIAIHKKNGGPSDARNAGIKISHGKWLGFVDGDDYVLPTMYEDLYEHRVERGITVCGYFTEKDGNRVAYKSLDAVIPSEKALDLYLNNELYSCCYRTFTYFGSYPWNKLYDHTLFSMVSYPKGKKYEDMYIIFDLLHQAESICFIPDCEYIYVQNSSSITHETNIIRESYYARLEQKRQLNKYWGRNDSRIDDLIACEFFTMLYYYSLMPKAKRAENETTAKWAWKNLKHYGYFHLPWKIRTKVFFYGHFPAISRIVRDFIKTHLRG